MTVEFTLNGSPVSLEIDAQTLLLEVLRNDLELNGPKFGCGLAQCGACANGVIITAAALLKRNPTPDAQEIAQALSGHLCRCGAQRKSGAGQGGTRSGYRYRAGTDCR